MGFLNFPSTSTDLQTHLSHSTLLFAAIQFTTQTCNGSLSSVPDKPAFQAHSPPLSFILMEKAELFHLCSSSVFLSISLTDRNSVPNDTQQISTRISLSQVTGYFLSCILHESLKTAVTGRGFLANLHAELYSNKVFRGLETSISFAVTLVQIHRKDFNF